MKKMFYAIAGFLLVALARLPLGVLYVLSDLTWFVLCYIVGYRRRVIIRNLRACYPSKTEAELKKITRDFYRNLSDYFFETVKLLHISDDEMARRLKFDNLDLIESILRDGRSVTVYFSHCFNWEWAPSVTLHLASLVEGKQVRFCQIYRPLRNEWFDRLMLGVRSRFGSVSIKKTRTLRDLVTFHRKGELTVTGFMSDKKPSHGDPIHVIEFLRRPTAVITGTAVLACRMSTGVVYWDTVRERRGHYRIVTRPISDNASAMTPEDVTARYFKLLEQTIDRDPANWLWSHNRWKHPVTLPDNNNEQ